MKIIISALLIAFVVSYTFEDYVTEFNKTYVSDDDKMARQQIFNANLAYYQQFNSQNHGYNLGATIWSDRYDSEIQQSLSVRFNQSGVSDEPVVTKSSKELRVSSSAGIDWRSLNGVSSVKDQGSCGDCWAFSSVATLESYFLIKNKTSTDLSEEYVLECTQNNNTCNGGSVSDAMNLLVKTGAPLQTQYPYLGTNYAGSSTPTSAGICTTNSDNFKKGYSNTTAKTYYSTNKTFVTSLIDNGPVSSVFISDNNFQAYKSNIFYCNYTYSDSLVNHAIQLVGYNSSGNYYIIKNSWGTSWGMDGFAYVDMDLDCDITRAVYQLVWETNLVFMAITLFVFMTII